MEWPRQHVAGPPDQRPDPGQVEPRGEAAPPQVHGRPARRRQGHPGEGAGGGEGGQLHPGHREDHHCQPGLQVEVGEGEGEGRQGGGEGEEHLHHTGPGVAARLDEGLT